MLKEANVSRILNSVSNEIERAAFGLSTWSDVALRLTEGFPGSSCVILSEDSTRRVLNHCDAINIERTHMDAYSEHFAFCNPWLKVRSPLPNGACVVSERDFPVREIANTEFYNDFVTHIPNFDASTALFLDTDSTTTFRIPLHYSVAYSERYDPWAELVMSRLVGVLKRTANALAKLREEADVRIAGAALANRGCKLALVVDNQMKILDANPAAAAALEKREIIYEKLGRLSFRERKLADAILAATTSVASSPTSRVSSIVATTESGRWIIHFSIVPGSRPSALLSSRPLVLIEALNVSAPPSLKRVEEFSRYFKLTAAEKLFCDHLVNGVMVKDIAVATGVTFETARFRLQSIFRKTDVHRQGELISLMHRFDP